MLHEPKRWPKGGHGVNYASVDLSRTDTATLHKKTRNKKKQAILRVKSPYKNGYGHIPIPAVLYRRHFHRNLTRQNALFLSKRRKGYHVENTVFEDPGKLLECRLVGRNLLGGNSNEVFYVSPKHLQTIQCTYSKNITNGTRQLIWAISGLCSRARKTIIILRKIVSNMTKLSLPS